MNKETVNNEIIYFNCQGYINNRDQIKLLVQKSGPLFVCLTETHITDNILDCEFQLDGYRTEQCTTENSRTGGVILYISNRVKYENVKRLKQDNFLWLISIKFKLRNHATNYMLSVIYHPPKKEDSKFIKIFEDYLQELSEINGNQIILGDFNYDLLKDTYYANRIKDIIYKTGYKQMVTDPTRITSESATLIDYVITNIKQLQLKVNLSPKISDHLIISVYIEAESLINESVVLQNKRCFKHFNEIEFQKQLIDTNWNNSIVSANQLADKLILDINTLFNKMCPIQKVVVPKKHINNKWMTEEILHTMKLRDDRYKIATITRRDEDWNQYKSLRNLVVRKMNLAKNKFYLNVIDNNKQNSREMWKHLKTLLPGNKEIVERGIKFNDTVISDEKLIAVNFNKFFIDSINNIVKSIHPFNDHEYILNKIKSADDPLSAFKSVNLRDVKMIVKNLKNTGGCDDGLSTKIIKCAFDAIGNRFVDVINCSLYSGVFPENWKTSVIVPVPKIQKTILCDEFRPINIVPVYEKILEIIVKEQLVNYCDRNSILVHNQSGFRAGHSCESVIMKICDIWFKSIDNNQIILAVFLDFKRAFETINRELLIKKLEKIGVRGTALDWFRSYLLNRYQKVKFNNNTSAKIESVHGVPQGTVLGPILFTIFINDIVSCMKYSEISLFADDSMIYIIGNNIQDMLVKINYDINELFEWLCDNSLSINVNKSKAIVFGSRSKVADINTNRLDIKIDNRRLDFVSEVKYLGIKLDQSLSFHNHALYIMNKMSKKTFFLRRISKNLSIPTRLLLYKSIILPHVEFCSTVLFNLPSFRIQEIQCIQNRCMRAILACNKYTPIKTMLNVLSLMSIKEKILFNTLLFIYKVKNKMLPSYLYENLEFVSDIHNYNTRNKDNFNVKICRTALMRRSVFSNGLVQFNMLPSEIKKCKSVKTFKYLLNQHIRKNKLNIFC